MRNPDARTAPRPAVPKSLRTTDRWLMGRIVPRHGRSRYAPQDDHVCACAAAQCVISTFAITRYSTSTTVHRTTLRKLTGRMRELHREQMRAPGGADNPQCGQEIDGEVL